jgi:hypothetical protein
MRSSVKARIPTCHPFRRLFPAGAALAALLLPLGPAAALEQAAALYDELQLTRLDPARAVVLEQVDIQFGSGRLHVHDGVLVPTQPVAGRTVEWVFVGQARFRFEPPDEIEANQLELFAGQRELDISLESAVMVRADDTPVRELLEHHEPAFLGPSMLQRVEAIHREWLEGAERAANGVRGGVFNALIGDRAFSDYFAIWCRSYEIGDFIYEFDPEDTEPHTLAHFSPLEIRGWDRLRLERHLKYQQKRGRWLDTRIQDMGDWDIWLSGPWDPSGKLGEASPGFEAEHYELDATIGRDETTIQGRATLDVISLEAGRRVIPLELFRDLRAETVHVETDEPLFFFRSGGDLMVVLNEPSSVGQRIRLEIVYQGKALRWVDRKMFDLEDTANWYPHCGTTDRATYDVTLRWPRGLDLLASGRVVESGRDGRKRWQRRVLDEPAIAFSFVMGRFEIERAQAGHVELEVAFNRSGPHRLSAGVRSEMIDAIRRSLTYFEETFGPYPLDHLTVVTLPRRYSQSFLGFITLADSILPPNIPPGGAEMNWYRSTTVAHEVAHQWWGNMIGWSSYRDQWLSEAMANYSAMQFWSDTEEGGAAFFSELSAGWRRTLNQTTPVGRTVESLGPIVLGVRLNSTLADNGYRAIVYRKGAVVLSMLARIVGKRPFSEMMRSLTEVASNHVVSTATFVEALEHMSGLDLSDFARRYIYGTGIPEVYYDYGISGDPENGWTIEGQAHLVASATYEQAVRTFGQRRWDVVRTVRPRNTAAKGSLVVPYRIVLDDGRPASEPDTARRLPAEQGNLTLDGSGDRFTLKTQTRPLGLALDPRGEILAGFYSAQTHPKKVAALQAESLLIGGDFSGAEAHYRRALEAPAGKPDKAAFTLAWMQPSPVQQKRDDALTHLRLARLALDRGDETLARREIEAAVAILGPDSHALRIERAALEGRIDLRNGDYSSAFKRSKKALRLFSPRRQQRYWRLRGWQAQVGADWPATTDVLAILAVAAFETGHNQELRWALEGAKDRGVDLSVLQPLAQTRLRNSEPSH